MNRNINIKLDFLFLLLFLVLLFVPTCFASEINDNSTLEVSNTSDDVLAAGDVYFNASVENDGSGTINSPYKYITSSRITSNSILHFANGEYSLSNSKTVYTISLIGEDADKTIIKGDGSLFTVSGTLTLQNVTISNGILKNHGTIKATNTIFKDGNAEISDNYDGSFGGAIFNDADYYYPTINLDNCTLMNNSAYYGGAIYLNGGTLTATNTKFIDNYAKSYGGAIACEESSRITITDCFFDNDYSIFNAGGAIYARNSSLTVTNSNFTNCSATFGGAICDLSSRSTISGIIARENKAKYYGGAYYKMYDTVNLKDSEFTLNEAEFGGAVSIDSASNINLRNSEFIQNTAGYLGGAIYLYNNDVSMLSNINYDRNKASSYSDLYEASGLNLTIGSGNYSQYVYDDSNYNGSLPSRYDLRDYGWVSPITDQQTSGNCWAFAALAALESCILKASNETYDFSENNIKNLIAFYSDYGWQMQTNEGGYPIMSVAYLVSWLGPILESEDPFDDYGVLSGVSNSAMHVQNIIYLPRNSLTDNDLIKEGIMKYGAVYTGIDYESEYLNTRTSAYYYPSSYGAGNHAVAIVGWDDDYSRYNFRNTPPANGAWIVKNSWGPYWGDDGFFYVSYYDEYCAEIGISDASFTFILNDTEKYDKNYQYDVTGMTDYLITGKSTIWYENIFNSTGNEILKAFSTYFNTTTDWEAYVYVNDDLKLTQNGTSVSGYFTIPLKEFIPLKIGDTFKIALKISADKYASFPICENISQTRISYSPGISFFSFDGINWIDLYDYSFEGYDHIYYSQVACIKAFTEIGQLFSNIDFINLTDIANIQTPFNITTFVLDQYNNTINSGEVLLTIDGKNYTSSVVDGFANFTVSFNDLGINNITAFYSGDYYSSSNITANVDVIKSDVLANISIPSISYNDDLVANITLIALNGNKINDEVTLIINNKRYLVNGSGLFTVPDTLDVGTYQAFVEFIGSEKYNPANASCEFNISLKHVDISLEVLQDFDNVSIVINLSQNLTGNVNVLVNNESYSVEAVNGTGLLNLNNMGYGEYLVNASFIQKDFEINNAFANFSVIPIKTWINASDIQMYYHDGTRFNAVLFDENNNALSNKSLIISINGNNYTRTTNENGTVSLPLNLNSDKYNITVYYNGEKKYLLSNATGNALIKSTIISSDVTKYFRNDTQFYALITDNEGNPLLNTKVTMNINGVMYNRTTNESGFVKLNINLNPGEYILTISNPLSGEMGSSLITVLSKLIENKDITKYYRNETQYTVKVVGNNGEALANRTVKFNINGVFYYRVSNSQGIAKLNLNLQPGNYIITAEYDSCRVSNNITVLSVLQSNDMSMSYRDGSTFNVKVLNGQGNPNPSQEIVFNINGVFYNRMTGDDGIARLNINLMAGEYIITSTFNDLNIANKITISA